MSVDPITEWDVWSDIHPPDPAVEAEVADHELPVIVDPDGRSIPYHAHPFGLTADPVLVHPWPTATVAW